MNFSASVDIELGSEATSKPSPFKYKRLLTKASVHYHSGEKESAFLDDAEEPLISGTFIEDEDHYQRIPITDFVLMTTMLLLITCYKPFIALSPLL